MQRGQIPNGHGTHSSCDIFTRALNWTKLSPTDLTNSCPPSPVPMGSWQGSLPPCRHSFSSLAVQKSHFLRHKSSNSISQTSSAKGWATSVLQHKPCSIPSAQTQKGCSCSHPGLAQCLLLSLLHLVQCQAVHGMWCVSHSQANDCSPSNAQRVQCTRARSEGGSGPFTWWNCKKIGTVLVVLALKKFLPSTRSDWVCWWLRTGPGGAMSYKKNMGLNLQTLHLKSNYRYCNLKRLWSSRI